VNQEIKPTPGAPVSPQPPATNRYGVDADYFRRELASLSASLDNRPAEELARYLRTLADAAAPQPEPAGAGVDLEAIEARLKEAKEGPHKSDATYVMLSTLNAIMADGPALIAEVRRLRARSPASPPRDREALIGLLLRYNGIPNAGPADPYYVDAANQVDRFLARRPAAPPRDLEAAPKYVTTTEEWEARLNAKFLEGVHDILVWSGCYTGDCPHHDQKECDAHMLEVGQQVAVEFLQDAAPMPHKVAHPPEETPAPGTADLTDALFGAFEEGRYAGIEEQINIESPTPTDLLWQRSEAFQVARRLRAAPALELEAMVARGEIIGYEIDRMPGKASVRLEWMEYAENCPEGWSSTGRGYGPDVPAALEAAKKKMPRKDPQ
jgi:hypothetical protein